MRQIRTADLEGGGPRYPLCVAAIQRCPALDCDSVGRHGQRSQAHTGGVEDSVAHCWRKSYDGRLSRACRGLILAIDQNNFDRGNIAEARKAIAREAAVEDAAIFEFDGFE